MNDSLPYSPPHNKAVTLSLELLTSFHQLQSLYEESSHDRKNRLNISEPAHGKTNNLHRRKQNAQISFAVTAKLISAFVFSTLIVQFLYFQSPKFQSSNHASVTVQYGLCQTWSEPKLWVFTSTGSINETENLDN